MGILSWIIFGALAGWVAGKVFGEHSQGCLTNIIIGVIPYMDIWWLTMAISIIFGLLFATVLTLLLVPVLYKIFFKVNYKGKI